MKKPGKETKHNSAGKKKEAGESMSLKTAHEAEHLKQDVKKVIAVTRTQLIGVVLGVMVLIIIFLFIFIQPSTPKGKVIATVEGYKITEEEINNTLALLSRQNPFITKDDVLNQTIVRYMVLAEAKKQKIEVDEQEVDEYIKNVEQTFQQQLEPALQELGLTKDQLKQQIREQLMITNLLKQQVTDDTSSVADEEIKAFYEENQASLRVEDQVNASHILVKTEDKAKEVLASLNNGANFQELAAEKSIDPSAKTNNGNLGFFGKGQMVPEFEQAAFALDVGAWSAPVKSQFGYHVILVHNKKAAQQLSFEEVKEDIRKTLVQQKQQENVAKYIEGLRAKAKIKIF